jgi:hypothetical protein
LAEKVDYINEVAEQVLEDAPEGPQLSQEPNSL